MEPRTVVLCVDGGDGAAGSAAVQFHHQRAVFAIFSNQAVSHLVRQAEEEHGHEDGAGPGVRCSRVFICRIRSVGFMSPISETFNNSNALVQRALVYLDTSRAVSCSYESTLDSSMSLRLSVMLVQTSVGNAP